MRQLSQYCIETCTRCMGGKGSDSETDEDLLSELAYNEDRYLHDLANRAREDEDSAIHREALKQMEMRLEEEGDEEGDDEPGMFVTDQDGDDECEDGATVPRTEEITDEDVKRALEEYEHKGMISIQNGKVVVTSKGVNKLAAGALDRILRSLRRKSAGANPVEKYDFGTELSTRTRPYEVGDDYSAVDLERTALNALSRCGEFKFKPEDFEIFEEVHRSKLNAAIIIDESGSMRDSGKLGAAMETALALSKLIMREPENNLKVFVFSDEVKQIEPWEIVNQVISGGDTDIKAGLAAFRRTCRHEYGDKQAYVITDTEPNNQDGMHVPLEKAASGLIEEASRYRQEKIGLNIIMLDESPELKTLASTIARQNLGRVFFTNPSSLGEIIVEDYLKNRTVSFSR